MNIWWTSPLEFLRFYKTAKESFFFKIKQLFFRMKLVNGKHISSSKNSTDVHYKEKKVLGILIWSSGLDKWQMYACTIGGRLLVVDNLGKVRVKQKKKEEKPIRVNISCITLFVRWLLRTILAKKRSVAILLRWSWFSVGFTTFKLNSLFIYVIYCLANWSATDWACLTCSAELTKINHTVLILYSVTLYAYSHHRHATQKAKKQRK